MATDVRCTTMFLCTFIALKFTGYCDWSWWAILWPLWLACLMSLWATWLEGKAEKRKLAALKARMR